MTGKAPLCGAFLWKKNRKPLTDSDKSDKIKQKEKDGEQDALP